MDYELELTKSNRLNLARAFHKSNRVDYSIECVLEGQMGKAFVDNLTHPSAYRITVVNSRTLMYQRCAANVYQKNERPHCESLS